MSVSFDKVSDKQIIRKLAEYIRSKVPFSLVAKKYRLRYSPNNNFFCWLHHEVNNPSARVKTRGGRESYVCYAECGVGDVIWLIRKLEELPSIPATVEFMDEYFELNLYANVEAILGIEKPALTVREQIESLSRSVSLAVSEAVAVAYNGIPQGCWQLPRPGLDPISRIECSSSYNLFWYNLDWTQETVRFLDSYQQAEKLLLRVRDEAVTVIEKFEYASHRNVGLTLESVFGDINGEGVPLG